MQLSAKDIRYTWKFRGGSRLAVENFSAEFDSGIAHVICGPSGSGKSTLSYLLAGLTQPECGEVMLDGASVEGHHSKIAYVFQFPENIFFEDTVAEELADLCGDAHSEVPDSFARLGVSFESVATKHPFHLSAGYGRLVAMALQAARSPRVLILDEPTIGLDWRFHRRVTQFLKDWVSPDRVLILITHDLDLMREVGGKSWLMSDGRLVWRGDTPTLLADARLLNQYSLQA